MATVTYVNNDYSVLATAMQQLVTMGYFDSVEYDSTNNAVVCKDADENAVLTLTKNSTYQMGIALRLDDGTVKTGTYTTGNNSYPYTPAYIYVCSGGAFILKTYTISGGTTYYTGGVIISKTNHNKIGIMFHEGAFNVNTEITDNLKPFSWATDDDSTQTGAAFSFAAPSTRKQETLVNVPTSAAVNSAPSYFPDVYVEVTTQYPYTASTQPVNITLNGKTYLWVGYYMIADD